MGLSCFRCQPLYYHSQFFNYQPLSYDFGCQPLLCTVLCTGVLYILGLSCLAVNLSFMILVANLYYVLVYCTVLTALQYGKISFDLLTDWKGTELISALQCWRISFDLLTNISTC